MNRKHKSSSFQFLTKDYQSKLKRKDHPVSLVAKEIIEAILDNTFKVGMAVHVTDKDIKRTSLFTAIKRVLKVSDNPILANCNLVTQIDAKGFFIYRIKPPYEVSAEHLKPKKEEPDYTDIDQ